MVLLTWFDSGVLLTVSGRSPELVSLAQRDGLCYVKTKTKNYPPPKKNNLEDLEGEPAQTCSRGAHCTAPPPPPPLLSLQPSCPLLPVSWGSRSAGMDGEAGASRCGGMTDSNPGGRCRTGSSGLGRAVAVGVGVGSAGLGPRVAPGDWPAAPPGRVAAELALWLEGPGSASCGLAGAT